MGYPVDSQRALQLPVMEDDTLVVNNGTDNIYIGTRRDNLKPLGFQLDPLAYVTLKAGIVYYAQSNSGVQEIDLLAGATAFAPSPNQVTTVLNAAALAAANAAALPTAAAIGAAAPTAIRLNDPNNTNTLKNFSSIGDTVTINCTQGISFSLAMNLGSQINTPMSCTFQFAWIDSSGINTISFENWEFNAGGQGLAFQSITTYLTDRCIGAFLAIQLVAVTGGSFAQLTAVILNFSLSSKPADRPRLLEDASNTVQPGDGILLNTGNISLGAGVTDTVQRVCQLTTGRILIAVQGTSSSFRLRGGFGLSFTAGITLVTTAFAASNNTIQYWEFPCPNRPFSFVFGNTGASAGLVSATVWSTGD